MQTVIHARFRPTFVDMCPPEGIRFKKEVWVASYSVRSQLLVWKLSGNKKSKVRDDSQRTKRYLLFFTTLQLVVAWWHLTDMPTRHRQFAILMGFIMLNSWPLYAAFLCCCFVGVCVRERAFVHKTLHLRTKPCTRIIFPKDNNYFLYTITLLRTRFIINYRERTAEWLERWLSQLRGWPVRYPCTATNSSPVDQSVGNGYLTL